MRIYPKLKVAAVQAGPVYMNMDESVKKACKLIAEAADKGAKLIAFPEAFLPGYPYWVWLDDPITTMEFTQMLFSSALECPGLELSKISQAAKENDIYVCISASEREGGSIYMTQFVFDDRGNLLGKHRKLKPMQSEKMVWGEGDASTMQVYNTPYGKMGSLASCEHMSPMNAMIMRAQREEIHIASYPALPKEPVTYQTYNANMSSANFYAVANACYVLFCTQVVNEDVLNLLCGDHPEYLEKIVTCRNGGLGGGNSCILNPDGEIISNSIPEDQEGIVTADIDLSAIGVADFFGDTIGHYCNPAVYLEVDTTPKKVVRMKGNTVDYALSYENLQASDSQ